MARNIERPILEPESSANRKLENAHIRFALVDAAQMARPSWTISDDIDFSERAFLNWWCEKFVWSKRFEILLYAVCRHVRFLALFSFERTGARRCSPMQRTGVTKIQTIHLIKLVANEITEILIIYLQSEIFAIKIKEKITQKSNILLIRRRNITQKQILLKLQIICVTLP